MTKIIIETEDDIDYALTSFENAADHMGAEYKLSSDDTYIQAKYGQ